MTATQTALTETYALAAATIELPAGLTHCRHPEYDASRGFSCKAYSRIAHLFTNAQEIERDRKRLQRLSGYPATHLRKHIDGLIATMNRITRRWIDNPLACTCD